MFIPQLLPPSHRPLMIFESNKSPAISMLAWLAVMLLNLKYRFVGKYITLSRSTNKCSYFVYLAMRYIIDIV